MITTRFTQRLPSAPGDDPDTAYRTIDLEKVGEIEKFFLEEIEAT